MTTLAGHMIAAVAAKNITGIGGVNPRISRDRAADNALYPLVTFTDPISSVIALRMSGVTVARTRRMQWDLWQLKEHEDYGLVEALKAALDGMRITGPFDDVPGVQVFGVRIVDWHRLVDPKPNLVHHTIDVLATHAEYAIPT